MLSRVQGEQSPPAYHDKLVEVYGLTQGALHQGWNVRSVENHTKRLGQGGGVRLYVQASESNHSVYVLMDGEDWWQKVPSGRSDNITKDGVLVRPAPHSRLRNCALLSIITCRVLPLRSHHPTCSVSCWVLFFIGSVSLIRYISSSLMQHGMPSTARACGRGGQSDCS